MGKVNISLPDGLLEEIDRRADARETSRSGFIREATEHYLTALDEARAQAAREERVGAALAKMRRLAPVVGAPDAAKVIREQRSEAPRWHSR